MPTDVALPSVIPVARARHTYLDLRRMIQAIAMPQFALQVPSFNGVRQVAWDLYNELVTEGTITKEGKPQKGCAGCKGGQMMKRYKGVHRAFVHQCLRFNAEDPELLEPLKSYFNTEHLTIQDPDTGEFHRI